MSRWFPVFGLVALAGCSVDVADPYAPYASVPEYITVALYDATPDDTLDAGAFVGSAELYVNGKLTQASDVGRPEFRRAFVGDRDLILLPRDIPLSRPQNGPLPVIVEFATDVAMWDFEDGSPGLVEADQIESIEVEMSVGGNYSCDLVHMELNAGSYYDAGLSLHEFVECTRGPYECDVLLPRLTSFSTPAKHIDLSAAAFESYVVGGWVDSVPSSMNGCTFRTGVYRK